MSLRRFRSPEVSGVFGDEATRARWKTWESGLIRSVRDLERRHLEAGGETRETGLPLIAATCAFDLETAIHLVVGDMLDGGVTQTHLALVGRLAEMADLPPPDVAHGKVRQAARLLAWYDAMCDGPDATKSVIVHTECRSHVVRGEYDAVVEVVPNGDGVDLRIMPNGITGAAVTLDREASDRLMAAMEAMVPGTAGRFVRGSTFLGREGNGEDGDRLGLRIGTGNLGEPYREVVSLSVLGPDWVTYASADLDRRGVHELLEELKGILDEPSPDATGPSMS